MKNQITINKYIKEVEPNFLTFAEKEQIKFLHESDPFEWTVEKLSKSFPGLPNTINKVLQAKGTTKSKESILRYDEKVVNNWRAFREGELSLSPKVEEHLQKFTNRHIILANRDKLAAQFIPTKVVFSKPKSTFFSTIAENFLLSGPTSKFYLNDEKINHEKNKKINKNIDQTEKGNEFFEDCSHNQNSMTFYQFLKSNFSCAEHLNRPEDIILKETYKKEMGQKNLPPDKFYLITESEDTIISKSNELGNDEISKSYPKEAQEIEISSLPKIGSCELFGINKSSLDTYVKEYHQNNIDYVVVAPYIKIPQCRYKRGMTYRVKNCYYDDDGEFLYRIPELPNLK